MWCEAFEDKNGVTKYRFYEKYKDPLSEKWRRVSVVMNKDTKPSQKEAMKRLDEKIKEKIGNTASKSLESLTVHKACDEWLEIYTNTSGAKRTTILEKKSIIKAIKLKVPEDDLIKNYKYKQVQDIFIAWNKEDRSKSAMTSYKSVLNRVFKHVSVVYGLTDISFLSDIVVPNKVKSLKDIESKRNNYLEIDELKLLINAMHDLNAQRRISTRKRNDMIIPLTIEFQALNGMRIAELLAIEKNNIDFKNKKLLINGSIIWETNKKDGTFGVKDTTKNEGSYRTISLSDRSIQILKTIILENKKSAQWEDDYIDRGFVFTNTYGNPIHTKKINEKLASTVDFINSNDKYPKKIKKRITTHTLRHTHISTLSQIGVSLKAIMERVGHTDHKTTLQVYSHVTAQMDKDMITKLNAISL
ncbi:MULTISPECIES: tyrosine-type recombinase/integrase [Macrococcoides]|uniref:tyrosine-type recombinase/integrase n=1 Tax=Macrococcoides TaxID=3076173 RepID=UPI00105D44EE|nr:MULTISPECIES: site-specific integrase [Macrococcus]TDM17574.1 site-specific integrase [Macrococcus caseolyticus]TDM23481.1 site-specific integrase [Macrococcus canis]